MYNQLEVREIFHLEFLRWFGRKVKSKLYAVKGGVNLRFFFKSFRYSEDLDIDARGIRKDSLTETVMGVLEAGSFQNTLRAFGVERVVPPDIIKAKQTETTQRFKVHLITGAGEDLFTKIEFSRRGFSGNIIVEGVSEDLTQAYKISPVLVPHYDIVSAIKQKLHALSARRVTQARDVFDLYILSGQYKKESPLKIAPSALKEARERVFDISFAKFRDTVLSYLSAEDQDNYGSRDIWDDVRLKTAHFLEGLG